MTTPSSTEFGKRHLTKPKWKDIVVAESPFVQLDEVLTGRADVALQDVPTLVQYARAHKDKVKVLWLDNPPTLVAAGFVTRKEDRELMDFINAGIRIIKVDGTIRRIDEKWKGLGHYEKFELVPGKGLAGD
jgi:ABC-type amino acid transport substrate-binding protein